MSLPPIKKVAPAPPVPAKTKPAPTIPSKPPCTPITCVTANGEKAKLMEPDTENLSVILVSNAKLTHPTAARPRMPGKRPPSQLLSASLLEESLTHHACAAEEKPKLRAPVKEPPVPAKPSIEASAPAPLVSEVPCREEQVSLEELKAELRSLRILMDLMRVQHQLDMEELKAEMNSEQTKRAALQVEIEQVKQMLLSLELQSPAGSAPTSVERVVGSWGHGVPPPVQSSHSENSTKAC